MEHAQPFDRPFPWRTAALVVGAVALAELLGLLALAGVRLAPDMRAATHPPAAAPVAQTTAHAARAATRQRGAVSFTVPAAAHALRPRSALSVLVLNGNGVNHAAGSEAARLLARGYRHAVPADAPSRYARSLVLFAPGYAPEAQRLAADAGIRVVSPLDGMRTSELRGSQLVVILGGS